MRWNIKAAPEPSEVENLMTQLGIKEELAAILIQRGVKDYDSAKAFFLAEEQELNDPFSMADMHKAVDRLEQARKKGEKIFVFGDYDVDGTSSVALVASCLIDLDIPHDTYIPDRYKEGYGLSEEGMKRAQELGCTLVIALDCGIKGHKQVDFARSLGLDMIICDHHQPGESLPNALAVLDPKRADCDYPYKELSGCGVGFKLMQAWTQTMGVAEEFLNPLYDLLAVSIAADIVPITEENRTLMARGLKVLNENPRTGIEALMEVSSRKGAFSTEEVVFQLAPRINAAGRIEHGKLAVDLLTTKDREHAGELSKHINELNQDRKTFDETIATQALDMLEGTEENYTSVVFNETWHKGVIGIAASRLTETYYRPTVVLTRSGNVLAGSARSVKGFNLYDAIDQCRDHLIQFGGHAFAAGMTMREDQLEGFQSAFENVVKGSIGEEQRIPTLDIDRVIEMEKVDRRFYNAIQRMGPFGPGNMTPVFACFGLQETGESRQVGAEKSHLKTSLVDETGQIFDGIGFRIGEKLSEIQNNKVDVAFTLSLNVWNGRESLQLMIRDIRPSLQS